jgi:addiction module RelE/StbE family toxin
MKKTCPIQYLPPAEKDLEELFSWIAQDYPSRAIKFLEKIDQKISRLSRFPFSGSIPKDLFLKRRGYRILIIEDYLIFYRFEKGKVWIYRILHGKRKYKFLLT